MTGSATLTGDLRGELVEITSRGGIVYRGIVHDIRPSDTGEIFVLTSDERLVYVTDRAEQIRLVSA